jgi:uncharacterized protein YndB with AHSA1/START domain
MSDAPDETLERETGAPPDAVIFECELDAPPAKVWRALNEPEIRRDWLGEAETGPAEVRRADPPERLDLAWPTREGESLISFRVDPGKDGGSRLTIVHQAPESAVVLQFKPRAAAAPSVSTPRWRMAA